MKTPKEIKSGMKQDCGECDEENFCPYIGIAGCIGILHKDALALIQKLEAENAKLKRERDAAVEQLRDAFNCCKFCKHMPSDDYICQSKPELDRSCWEWRGPCKENGCSEH